MTRIIAGDAGSLRLVAPAKVSRPTSDRVREAIFSRVASLSDIPGATVLDLFAGTGALGLEAASRGASAVWLVAPCAELIEDARTDDSVDLALGTYFSEIQPNDDAEEVLRTLASAAPGAEPAPLDADLLSAARESRC